MSFRSIFRDEHGKIMKKTTIVMVGGFLGAGKTTLLLAAAQELTQRKLRSALIMNDQGDSLVDSELAAIHGSIHREVTGGCFCCRFSDLANALDELRAYSPDVIFAEPVGSCTDISATTLQPLHACADYELAPFTVLVDPARASELLHPDANSHLQYLFIKQIQEADIVCFTKSDLYPNYPDLSAHSTNIHVRQLGATTGVGVAAWLDEVLYGKLSAGTQILDVDYRRYAKAEAALVWLNLRVQLKTNIPITPAVLIGPFFDQLAEELTADDMSIVHMKAIVRCPTGFIKVAICSNEESPRVDGDLDASPASSHELLLNLRGLGEASDVCEIVEANVEKLNAQKINQQISCFHPSAPVPQYRYSESQSNGI
jgi:hypothetical protein